jgi:magnesium-transporting ATPase (P-type)
MLPIDMLVLMAVQRYQYLLVFYKDLEMLGSRINNLFILEDIAEIDHMFCDKTGTLTKN